MDGTDAVREAALRAFGAVQPGATVLDLVDDSVLDIDAPADARRLVFARGETELCVDLRHGPDGTTLLVDAMPDRAWLEVQVLSAEPRQEVPHAAAAVHGHAPLRVTATRRGPVSLAVTILADDGYAARFQTAWIVL